MREDGPLAQEPGGQLRGGQREKLSFPSHSWREKTQAGLRATQAGAHIHAHSPHPKHTGRTHVHTCTPCMHTHKHRAHTQACPRVHMGGRSNRRVLGNKGRRPLTGWLSCPCCCGRRARSLAHPVRPQPLRERGALARMDLALLLAGCPSVLRHRPESPPLGPRVSPGLTPASTGSGW